VNISDEAVKAAERVLLGYTGGCACHEGYAGRNLIDPDCRYHDVPPEVAREILESAAPYMLASVAEEREGGLFRFTLAQRGWLRSDPYRSQT
jgi:hypothetical protein